MAEAFGKLIAVAGRAGSGIGFSAGSQDNIFTMQLCTIDDYCVNPALVYLNGGSRSVFFHIDLLCLQPVVENLHDIQSAITLGEDTATPLDDQWQVFTFKEVDQFLVEKLLETLAEKPAVLAKTG